MTQQTNFQVWNLVRKIKWELSWLCGKHVASLEEMQQCKEFYSAGIPYGGNFLHADMW
jgi:hypothetical protein